MTEHRAKYTHTAHLRNGDIVFGYFHDEYSTAQSHDTMVGSGNATKSEIRFSDFGGNDCSPRIIKEWKAA